MKIFTRHLTVRKSRIPSAGKGLFTGIAIPKGERIVEYKGRLQPWRILKKVDGLNGYILRVSRTRAIDAKPSRTHGRYANDAAGIGRVPGIRNNAEYVVEGTRCFIESTRPISKGEEILVAYGREYWDLMRKIYARRK